MKNKRKTKQKTDINRVNTIQIRTIIIVCSSFAKRSKYQYRLANYSIQPRLLFISQQEKKNQFLAEIQFFCYLFVVTVNLSITIREEQHNSTKVLAYVEANGLNFTKVGTLHLSFDKVIYHRKKQTSTHTIALGQALGIQGSNFAKYGDITKSSHFIVINDEWSR